MTITAQMFSSADNKEVEALIETLHATGRRLEEITGGEVDAVVGRDGAAFLLRRAQDELRLREASRQAAILSVLPAHIALVDKLGVIVSVNRAWEEFAETNGLLGPGYGIGINYLAVCDKSRDGAEAGEGIRSVLAGRSSNFSMEYPCHSPTQQRWFLMTVTPLSDSEPSGAVISHFNITKEHATKLDLLASELQFRQMAESVGDVFTLREVPSRRLIYANQAYETIFGLSCASLYAKPDSWLDVVHPDDKQILRWQNISEATTPHVEHDFRIVRPDGEIRWIESRRSPVFDDAGVVVRVATISTDITRRKKAELGMRRLNRVYSVLEAINALIVRVDNRHELFAESCRIAVEQGGFDAAQIGTVDAGAAKVIPVAITGKNPDLVFAIEEILARSSGQPTAMAAQVIAGKAAIAVNDLENDSGVVSGATYVTFGVHSKAVLPLIVAGEVKGVLALYAGDIDFFHAEEMRLLTGLADHIALAIDHIDRQERLELLASFDSVTGLSNRGLFLERMGQHMRGAADNGHRLALVLIDLERFKNINDTLGWPAGDALLQQVAQRLTKYVGDVTWVGRIAADRFAVAWPEETRAGDAERRLDRMIQALLDHPFKLGNEKYRISAKFGVAVFPDDGVDAPILFKNAEAALKKAKAGGIRKLFYTSKMTESVAQQLNLENQLRRAMENEEFVLHYQPKVDLGNREVTSVEALIRWNDPQTGLVPPNIFIPILEETGMIYEVGRWALRQSLKDYLRWRREGLHAVRIAVNVSPLQFRHPGFIAMIEQIVATDPHAAQGLELELTEGIIMDDTEQAIVSLQAIRALGIRIAIDDFGTGFSSLGYLAKLPIDTLKIDRLFITGMTIDSQGLALVSTIINLAHSLQLKVVAEGVETDKQSSLLRLLKCDEMQGYLFSKPVPVDVLEAKFLAPLAQA